MNKLQHDILLVLDAAVELPQLAALTYRHTRARQTSPDSLSWDAFWHAFAELYAAEDPYIKLWGDKGRECAAMPAASWLPDLPSWLPLLFAELTARGREAAAQLYKQVREH